MHKEIPTKSTNNKVCQQASSAQRRRSRYLSSFDAGITSTMRPVLLTCENQGLVDPPPFWPCLTFKFFGMAFWIVD